MSSLMLLLLMTTGISHVQTASPPRNAIDSENKVQCGLWTCDLRSHYCDPVIDGCARCDDDCHPARINGNRAAIEECQRNCAVYYKLSAIDSSSSTTSLPSSKNDAAAASPSDQAQNDVPTTGELRILIVLIVIIAVSISCLAITACILVSVTLCRKCQRWRKGCVCNRNAGNVPSMGYFQGNVMSPTFISSDRQLAKIHGPSRKHSLDRTTRLHNGPIILIGHGTDVTEHTSVCVLEPLIQT